MDIYSCRDVDAAAGQLVARGNVACAVELIRSHLDQLVEEPDGLHAHLLTEAHEIDEAAVMHHLWRLAAHPRGHRRGLTY